MKILYIAEIIGKAGVFAFKKALPILKKKYTWDFLILNADGATGGNGLGRTHAAYLRKLGADAITLGECCFYKKDLTENLDKIPYVLRPENLSTGVPGIGAKIFKTANGKKIAVAVLLGQNGFFRLHASNPYTYLNILLERFKKETPYIIVDFHAQATAEKKTLFFAADGCAHNACSAVIGSHARVQTADETIMKNGTAVITDAGRTGSTESVGGCEINSRINEYITGIPDWTREAWDKMEVQGVYLKLFENGKAKSIERVRVSIEKKQE